jgi:ABC-type transport system involved in cytochrome c biogenesis permease subunit
MMDDELIIVFWMSIVIAVVEAACLFAILRRARFALGWQFLGFLPLAALMIQLVLVFLGTVTPTEGFVLSAPLLLLPYLFLAFRSWPVAAVNNSTTGDLR